MRRNNLIVCLLLTFTSLQGEAVHLKSDKRDVENFSKISFLGKGNLYIQQGEHENVQIIADENQVPYILTEVDQGTLKISERAMGWLLSLRKFEPFSAYVTVKNLEEITFAGTGVVQAEKGIKSPSLILNLTGSGKVNFAMDVDQLTSHIAGSGEYDLKGRADKQAVSIAGRGTYKAFKLVTQEASVDISGFGDVDLNVQKKLDVLISGKGSVTYMGKPAVTQKIIGTGNVEELR